MPEMLLAYRTIAVKCADVSVPGVACRAKGTDSNDILGQNRGVGLACHLHTIVYLLVVQ